MKLPDYDRVKKSQTWDPEQRRSEMKKEGRLPPRQFQERPLNISSTGGVFEQYVPPEGDGRVSTLSKEGAKQRLTGIEKKGKSYLQLRKIRQFEEDFDTKEFAQTALELYTEAHQLLQDVKKNEMRLHDLVTEKAYPDMTHTLTKRTFRWRFIESIEPPHVVHIRCTEMLAKTNLYAQVTVRMHTKQALAIYDQFGRLMYGDENIAKDILEYVVFEKHLANEYGTWRIHGKVVPDWMPPRQPIIRTYIKQEPEPIPDIPDEPDASKKEEKPAQPEQLEQGSLATA
ncbi:large ribosomal subunit protein mL45-like isoform X2 [Lineus longissimus]